MKHARARIISSLSSIPECHCYLLRLVKFIITSLNIDLLLLLVFCVTQLHWCVSPINPNFKYNVPCYPHPYISVSWLVNLFENGQCCQRFYICWNSFFCYENLLEHFRNVKIFCGLVRYLVFFFHFWNFYTKFICKINNIFRNDTFWTFTTFCQSQTMLQQISKST